MDTQDAQPEPDEHPDEHPFDAREEHVAKGPRPEDVGGTEETAPKPGREHPGDAKGG